MGKTQQGSRRFAMVLSFWERAMSDRWITAASGKRLATGTLLEKRRQTFPSRSRTKQPHAQEEFKRVRSFALLLSVGHTLKFSAVPRFSHCFKRHPQTVTMPFERSSMSQASKHPRAL